MYMVIGEQRVPAVGAEEQRAQFVHMSEIVRQSPGFVRGWWGPDEADRETAHALVVLDTLENARALKRMVEENVTGVRLRLMEIAVGVDGAS